MSQIVLYFGSFMTFLQEVHALTMHRNEMMSALYTYWGMYIFVHKINSSLSTIMWYVYQDLHCRSGFDCEILLIANCEFFHNSQSKESQEKEYAINNILPAWQFAIINIAI